MDMENGHDMKKKAAAEALHDLIQQMMGLEGKKHEEKGEQSVAAKMEEGGMTGGPEQALMAGTPEDGSMDPIEDERKDFMSFKKKPMVEKSMTVVMASPKMKKKMKGM